MKRSEAAGKTFVVLYGQGQDIARREPTVEECEYLMTFCTPPALIDGDILAMQLQAAGLDELIATDTVLNKQGTDAFLCLEGDEDAGVQRMARCGYVSAYGTEAQEEPHLRAGFHITDRP